MTTIEKKTRIAIILLLLTLTFFSCRRKGSTVSLDLPGQEFIPLDTIKSDTAWLP